jgi:pimeloyl-ACP methyl ester carboxylesterase
MADQYNHNGQRDSGPQPQPRAAMVTSNDGTVVGYQTIGNGPGIIVLPGALSTGDDFLLFGRELADSFTLHLVDRRGRGRSGSQGSDYSVAKECEDVAAVQAATGAVYLFGHSYGGFIALEAAKTDRFEKIAVYEPGISIGHSIPLDWLPDFERALAAQDDLAAFVAFSRPHVKAFQRMPLWLAKAAMRPALRGEFWEHMRPLLPTTVAEHQQVGLYDSTYQSYASIAAPVLLVAGGKSEPWAQKAIAALGRTIPHVQAAVLPKLEHLAPLNRYAPPEVTQCVRPHFLAA